MKLVFLARGLCAAALLVTLAACGGGSSQPASSANSSTKSNADGPVAAGDVPTASLRCAP